MKKTTLISASILSLGMSHAVFAGEMTKDTENGQPATSVQGETTNEIIESAEEDHGKFVPKTDDMASESLKTTETDASEEGNAITAEAAEDQGSFVPDTNVEAGGDVALTEDAATGEPNLIVEESKDDRGRFVPKADASDESVQVMEESNSPS